MKRRNVAGIAVGALLLSTFAGLSGARAEVPSAAPSGDGVRHYEPKQKRSLNLAESVPATLQDWLATPDGGAQLRGSAAAAGKTPPVGTKRMWPATDFEMGVDYLKEYTLRGVGSGIEVWVASGPGPDGIMGTDPRPGDCRAALPGYTTITDEQVANLIHEYDDNILPKESKAFSVAPPRDGSKALTDLATSDLDFSGAGNRVVTLVDNIRDAAFYKFPQDRSGVAGFFAPSFNEMTDRNIMNIDAEDWAHSTGPNPPHQPSSDPCKNQDGNPHFYESVFAHEYQHLLEGYTDNLEELWINEGLSMYAESVVGYAAPDRAVNQSGYDAYIACFQGFRTIVTRYNPAPVPCGGPANSLTRWGDQGTAKELLADYGNAESFMLYLNDRFGAGVLSEQHRDARRPGLKSLAVVLATTKEHPKLTSVLHDYQLMTLVDKLLSVRGMKLTGAARGKVTTKSLNAAVNLLNPAATGSVGAAANGADYLALRGLGASTISGSDLKSLSFSGDRALPPVPMAWTVTPQFPLPTLAVPALPNLPQVDPVNPPALPSTPLDNPVLFSGNELNTDASMVFATAVPAANPTLTYTSVHNLEQDYDYGYTIVSTDGGKTYATLTNAFTAAMPGPNGMGFTGSSPVPIPQIFDLSKYAGQKVLLGVRMVSDGFINAGGWAVDDVRVGGQLISDGTATAPFRTMTEISPLPIKGWSLQLVGIDEAGRRIHVARFLGTYRVTLTKKQVKAFRDYPLLVAVVGYDDPKENSTVNGRYTVMVNRLGQAGGR